MTNLRFPFLVLLLVLFAQGCSVYTAFTHPPKVDIEGLENMKGIDRSYVMSECGAPISSEKNQDGGKKDIYRFYEGSSWAKPRGIFHLIADFFTLTLWELIAWPSELAARGDQMTAEAVFDPADKLISFHVIGRRPKELERAHQSGEAAQF
ncbi:MAG: hypothetical protein OEW33_11625 [Nitrospirota bacterium]|nr:hypothetical protein [Nitrospirota bacterium]MDH5296329.1 hypothetical protein [Nitrospirota bacterium]